MLLLFNVIGNPEFYLQTTVRRKKKKKKDRTPPGIPPGTPPGTWLELPVRAHSNHQSPPTILFPTALLRFYTDTLWPSKATTSSEVHVPWDEAPESPSLAFQVLFTGEPAAQQMCPWRRATGRDLTRHADAQVTVRDISAPLGPAASAAGRRLRAQPRSWALFQQNSRRRARWLLASGRMSLKL